MALFDKLKEKVNKVVDVEKLSEMANKTMASVKSEVAKTIDPSIKDQERLEKEKALQEQEEQKKREKEKLVNDFFASINLDEELEYIFAVLEKSGATAINFEKGVDHMLSKAETTLPKEEILPAVKKALYTRAFDDTGCAVAKAVATDYFVSAVVDDGLLSQYMRFAISREKGSYAFMEEPFIKALYGVAGHAVNYLNNGLAGGNYRTMTAVDFGSIIENSDVLKSYTDNDPFATDEVRAKWAEELCNAPLEIVKSSRVSGLLDKEEYVDALCYFAYIKLCVDEDPAEDVGISKIASVYLEHLKAYYNRIR